MFSYSSPDRHFLLARDLSAPLFQTGRTCSTALDSAAHAYVPAQCCEGDGLSGAAQCVRLKLCACGECPSAILKLPIPSLRKQSDIAGTLEDMRASPGISLLRETSMTSPSSQT